MTELNIIERFNELVANKQFNDWTGLLNELVANKQFNEWTDLLPKLVENEQFTEQFNEWTDLFTKLVEDEQFNEWTDLLPKLVENEQFTEQFNEWTDLLVKLLENEQFTDWTGLLNELVGKEQFIKQFDEWTDLLAKVLDNKQFTEQFTDWTTLLTNLLEKAPDKWIEPAKQIFDHFDYIPLPIEEDPDAALADARNLLQAALKIEHATIPVYLHMLYTLQPGAPWQVTECIRSVVIEEMLHFILAANVLNAIGGSPEIYTADFMPNFPTWLPQHVGDQEIQLLPFSEEAVDQGLAIERPKYIELASLVLKVEHSNLDAMTIGEFYTTIEFKLQTMVDRFGEKRVFCGNPAKQVTSNHYYYGGGGDVTEVYGLDSALKAIRQIKAQGEGANRGIWIDEPALNNDKIQLRQSFHEPAHYFRFNELKQGRLYQDGDTVASGPTGVPLEVPWNKTYKTVPNSKLHDYPKGSEVRVHIEAFNRTYSQLLHLLHYALNYEPDRLIEGVIQMCSLRKDYDHIVRNPFPGKPGYYAAPTFEFVANLPCPEKSEKKYL